MAALACNSGDLLVDLRDKIPRGLNSIDLMATIEPFYARFYIYQPGFPESLQHCCGSKPSSIIKVPVVDGRFCIRQSQPRDEMDGPGALQARYSDVAGRKFTPIASSELREAVADRPVLFRGLKNVHEHVLRPDAGIFAEQLRGAPEQRFLLSGGAGVEHGDLDVHDIFAPADSIAGRAVAEVRSVMLGDGHELVVFGHIQRVAHRAVKAVEDRLPVGFRLSGAQGDVNERHRGSLSETGEADARPWQLPHGWFTPLTK
jgi:hypothetical protein